MFLVRPALLFDNITWVYPCRVVPVSQFKDAFHGDDKSFEAHYDFPKPKPDNRDLCLHCLAGKRARVAATRLQELQYHNFCVYDGGFQDWEEQGGPILRGAGVSLVFFDQIKQGLEEKSIILIDVRKPLERFHPGRIPGSRNIPRMLKKFQILLRICLDRLQFCSVRHFHGFSNESRRVCVHIRV